MKNWLIFSFIIVGLQSCVIKEEITINELDKVHYNYSLNGANAKNYLPNDFFKEEIDFITAEGIDKLAKGMTVQQFYSFLKNKNIKSDELSHIESFFAENAALFNNVKNDSLIFNINDLNYGTSIDTDTESLNVKSQNLNNFISGFTRVVMKNENLEFMSNKKIIKNKSLTVDLDKISLKNFTMVFSDLLTEENSDLSHLNFIGYQITVNTPKPIKSTNIKGNSFSFDKKSVTAYYSVKDILDDKISKIEVVYE